MTRRRSFLGAVAMASALPFDAVRAQGFPSRPITLIAPSVVGGSTDVVCRAMAEAVGRRLGVAVVVENKAGAGGSLGGLALASARPDGHTVALLPLATFRMPLMQKMAFDPLRDIAYVAGLGGFVFGLAVKADAPFHSLAELIDHARRHPGEVSYGHAGIGSTPHLAVEELAQKTGGQFTAVPYKGSNEALAALLGGQISVMSGTTEFAPHVQSGKLRVLATLGAKRAAAFPDVPTLRESGVDIVNESPFGIGAPRGTDASVVRTLHDAFRASLDDPTVKSVYARFMLPMIPMNPAEYEAFARRTVASERATLARLGLLKKE
ncbi:Tripartite-type tricarboxylate transporter, receptor component TctC [Variovorax sp. OK605]|uniref:Bug family tripartite tricarboxylate transporter substrate binding protein n=1 Tax=Variovorax sp. OK605 TaxID=1855317 RepID=UPI0008E89229|nr:tripartite tricarboxylate transporter substrate binding protein [Variovorax sp. OK605]SFP55274.1 Tripartite-type tricarboxylate transporter, receptor component TctC [Variovorax sp. OK605]